eukprot:1089458-Amphidinium_carterae.1
MRTLANHASATARLMYLPLEAMRAHQSRSACYCRGWSDGSGACLWVEALRRLEQPGSVLHAADARQLKQLELSCRWGAVPTRLLPQLSLVTHPVYHNNTEPKTTDYKGLSLKIPKPQCYADRKMQFPEPTPIGTSMLPNHLGHS